MLQLITLILRRTVSTMPSPQRRPPGDRLKLQIVASALLVGAAFRTVFIAGLPRTLAGLSLGAALLFTFGLGGQAVSTVIAQDAGVTRCVEVVPYYYAIDAADARLLCPGIVEAMRDAEDEEMLDRNNSCNLFLALGIDDSDEAARQACLAVFVVVMDSKQRAPQAAAPAPKPAPPSVPAPKPASVAAAGGGSGWVDQAVRDYQASRRQQGIPYTASDLVRFYQCLTGQVANGREAALQVCGGG